MASRRARARTRRRSTGGRSPRPTHRHEVVGDSRQDGASEAVAVALDHGDHHAVGAAAEYDAGKVFDVGPPRHPIDREAEGQADALRRRILRRIDGTMSSGWGHAVRAGSSGVSRLRPSTPFHTPTPYGRVIEQSGRSAADDRRHDCRGGDPTPSLRTHGSESHERQPDPSHGRRQRSPGGEVARSGEAQRLPGRHAAAVWGSAPTPWRQPRRGGERPTDGGEAPHTEAPRAHPHRRDGVAVAGGESCCRLAVGPSLHGELTPGAPGLVMDDHARFVAAAPTGRAEPPHGVDVLTDAQRRRRSRRSRRVPACAPAAWPLARS